MVAPGLLSRKESRKDLWALILQHACLIILLLCPLLNVARCLKMLVFDRLGFPLYSGILRFSPQIHTFLSYQCILSIDLMLASTWMGTHGCFATLFPPSFFFPVDATRWWILGARCHRRRILLHGGHRRPRVVRRSQAGGLASSIVLLLC